VGNPYAPPEPGAPLPERPASPPPAARRGEQAADDSGPGQPGGPAGPDAREPDPEKVRDAARLVLRFTLLSLAGLLCLQVPVPWQAAGLLFTGAALYFGFKALRRVLAARARRGLLVSTVVGLVMTSLLMVMHVMFLVVWPAQLERQQCLDRALTVRAQEKCQQDYERWLRERSQGVSFSS